MREVVRRTRGGPVNEPEEKLQERLREAIAKGGPDPGLGVLREAGFAIDKEPEAGVGMRMRLGAGTDDGFTTTVYNPSPEPPPGWPAEVPFLAGVGGSLTLFDLPGRGFSVQWFKVPDPGAALKHLLDQSVAAGWHVVDTPASPLPPHMVLGQHVLLERNSVQRTLMSVLAKDFGMIQLVEHRAGSAGGIEPAPPS
jgi:hypothetical protein